MENVKILSEDISTNNKNLVAMSRRHLCRLANPTNKKYMEDLKFTLCECGLDIGLRLVPDCVYRCGCVKGNGCGWFDKAAKNNPNLTSTNIRLRYETYYDLIKKMETVQGEFTTIRLAKNARTEALTVTENANGIKIGAWHWQKLTKSVENMKSNGEKNTGVY